MTLDAFVNFIYPSASPLVVHGAHLLAMGKVSDDVEIKFEILSLEDDYDMSLAKVLATAVCKGSDILKHEFGSTDYLNICADFDAPVVIDASHAAHG